MTHQVVGYIRVSTADQNPDRQLQDIPLDKKFIDYYTGSVKDRTELNKCLEYVRFGDTLMVHSIDRLARNLQDLQEIVKTLVAKGVTVKFVKEGLVFNEKEDAMASLMLQTMGAFAEFERTMIRARQREGIAAAKRNGKNTGRPTKITKDVITKYKELNAQGLSIRQIAFRLGMSRATVYKIMDMIK